MINNNNDTIDVKYTLSNPYFTLQYYSIGDESLTIFSGLLLFNCHYPHVRTGHIQLKV